MRKIRSFLGRNFKDRFSRNCTVEKGSKVCTNDIDQTIINAQFQPVYSIRAPLIKLLYNYVEWYNSLLPIMQDIFLKIATAGISKLLTGFQQNFMEPFSIKSRFQHHFARVTALSGSKAAGPDASRPIFSKELCQEIAPVVAVEGKTSKLLKENKYRKPWATKRVKALQSKPKLFTGWPIT